MRMVSRRWLALPLACALLALAACGPAPKPALTADQILASAARVQVRDATFTVATLADPSHPIFPATLPAFGTPTPTATGATGATATTSPAATPTGATGTPQPTPTGTPAPGAIAFADSGVGALLTAPLRVTLDLTVRIAGASVPVSEILAGGVLYDRVAGQTVWSKRDTSAPCGAPLVNPNLLDYSALRSARLAGSVTIDGVRAWHISATIAPASPLGRCDGGQTEDLWLRQDTLLPIAIVQRFHGNLLTTTVSVNEPIAVQITFTHWNGGATIALPSPDDVVDLTE